MDILTQYSLLLTMVSLLEEAVNTLCRIHKDLGQFTTELKDVKGAGLERAAKYLKDVVGISGFKADQSWELYKRLEAGSLSWPRTSEEAADLTEEQFRYLMIGLNPLNPKVREVTPQKPT